MSEKNKHTRKDILEVSGINEVVQQLKQLNASSRVDKMQEIELAKNSPALLAATEGMGNVQSSFVDSAEDFRRRFIAGRAGTFFDTKIKADEKKPSTRFYQEKILKVLSDHFEWIEKGSKDKGLLGAENKIESESPLAKKEMKLLGVDEGWSWTDLILPVITGLTAIGLWINNTFNWENIKESISVKWTEMFGEDGLASWLGVKINSIGEWFGEKFTGLKEYISEKWTNLIGEEGLAAFLWTPFKALGDWISVVFSNLKEYISGKWTNLIGEEGLAAFLWSPFKATGEWIGVVFSNLKEYISGKWTDLVGEEGLGALLWSPFKAVGEWINDKFGFTTGSFMGWSDLVGEEGLGALLWSPFKAVGKWAKDMFADPVPAMKTLWNNLVGEGGLLDILWTPLNKAVTWVSEAFGWRDEDAPDFNMLSFIKDTWDILVKKITEGFSDFADWIALIPAKLKLYAMESINSIPVVGDTFVTDEEVVEQRRKIRVQGEEQIEGVIDTTFQDVLNADLADIVVSKASTEGWKSARPMNLTTDNSTKNSGNTTIIMSKSENINAYKQLGGARSGLKRAR